VHIKRIVAPPGVVEVRHLRARRGEKFVRRVDILEQPRSVRLGVGPYLGQVLSEVSLGEGDLLVPGGVLGHQRHGSVVHLGGDLVDHLAGEVGLLVEGR
jgi:hypothetical protein